MSNLSGPEQKSPYHQHFDDGFDLKRFAMLLWLGRYLMAASVFMTITASALVATSLPNLYKATALLAPTQSSSAGLSGLMSQYSGLASLAGVSIPSGAQDSRTQLGIELLKSRVFINEFIKKRDVLPQVMAVKEWDENSGKLIFDSNIYNSESNSWVRSAPSGVSASISLHESYEKFSRNLLVSQNQQTGFISLSVIHESPMVAANWVNWLVEDINFALRNQDISEAERSILYLKEQVENTSLTDLQAVFFDLIQSQTETVMLAKVRVSMFSRRLTPR